MSPTEIFTKENMAVYPSKDESEAADSFLAPQSEVSLNSSATIPINQNITFTMTSDGTVELNFTLTSAGKMDIRMKNPSTSSAYNLYLTDTSYNILASSAGLTGNQLQRIYGTIPAGSYKAILTCAGSTYDPSATISLTVLHNSNIDGFEMDDSYSQAIDMNPLNTRAVSRTIDTWSDVDNMKFTVGATSTVQLEFTSTTTAGQNNIAVLIYKLVGSNLVLLEASNNVLSEKTNQTGQTYALGCTTPNSGYTLQFSSGTYIFAVQAASTNAAGQPYIMGWRAMRGEIDTQNIIYSSRQMMYYSIGTNVYLNNTVVGTEWTRNFIFTDSGTGSYTKRNLHLSDISQGLLNYADSMVSKSPEFLGIGRFTSDFAGTCATAAIIELGCGNSNNLSALWFDYKSHYVSGEPIEIDYTDTLGRTGPSRLDWSYLVAYSSRTFNVVINYQTGQIIDFLSDLNPYYSTGTPENWTWSPGV